MLQNVLLDVVLFLGFATPVLAHFLWIDIDDAEGEHGAADIVFEETPRRGDGHYMDHFVGTCQTWFRGPDRLVAPLAVREATAPEQRWLRAQLPQPAPRAVDCYGKFGVYRYGDTDVLLHYYSRHLDMVELGDMERFASAEALALDLRLRCTPVGAKAVLIWRGEPAAGRTVHVTTAAGEQHTLVTDADGVIALPALVPGRHLFRGSVDVPRPGQDEGRDFAFERHVVTLTLVVHER